MRILVALIVVLLAGCVQPDADDDADQPVATPPNQRPAGWNETPELNVYSGFRAHSASQTLDAAPHDKTMREPASCVAYQLGQKEPEDTCAIQGPEEQFGETYGPWTVHATWDGANDTLQEEERDATRRTVVAFDADGKAVAHVPRAVPTMIE